MRTAFREKSCLSVGFLLWLAQGVLTSTADPSFNSAVVISPTGQGQDEVSTQSGEPQQCSLPSKILILAEPSPITYLSGQSLRFYTLLQHLAEHYPEDQVRLVTSEKVHPDPPTTCFDEKIAIHYTWGFRLPQYKFITLSTGISPKVWNLCRAGKPDILHVSSPGMLLFPAVVACRLQGIPLLMSYHTHLPVYIRSYMPAPFNALMEWLVWKILKILHSMADLTVVTSPQIASEFAAHAIPRTEIWPKGVNTTKFNPAFKSESMRHQMSDGNPDDLLLVYIGRLAKEKRLLDLKGVLEALLAKGIQARLCIVGSGPEEEALKEEFGSTPTVFLGGLQDLPLSQAFASGDVFVMPSDSETLGFVIMESMSSGVPVVACEAGGPIDLIEDGKTGFLVPVGNADKFVDRIETLMKNLQVRDDIVRRARAATEPWSWHASMEFMRQQAYPQAIANFKLRTKKSLSIG